MFHVQAPTLKMTLEEAESAGCTFDLLVPAELVATDNQQAPWRGRERISIVAFSDENLLVATQGDNVSAEFPVSSIVVPMSEIEIDAVLDLPKGDVSSGTIACASVNRRRATRRQRSQPGPRLKYVDPNQTVISSSTRPHDRRTSRCGGFAVGPVRC